MVTVGSSSPRKVSSNGSDGIYSIPLSVIIINHQHDNLQNNALQFMTTSSASDLKANYSLISAISTNNISEQSPTSNLSSSPNNFQNLKNRRKSSSFNSFDGASSEISSFHINLQGLSVSNKSLGIYSSPPTSPKYGKLFKNANEQESVAIMRRKFESFLTDKKCNYGGFNRETHIWKLLFLDDFYNVLNGKSRKFDDIEELFQRCDIFLSLLIGDLTQFKCLEMFKNEEFSTFSTTFKYPHLESFDLVIQEIITNSYSSSNKKRNSPSLSAVSSSSMNGISLLLAHEYLHKWLTELNSTCHEYLKLLSQNQKVEPKELQTQPKHHHHIMEESISPIFEEIHPEEIQNPHFDFVPITRKSSSSPNAFDIASSTSLDEDSSSNNCAEPADSKQKELVMKEIISQNPIFDLKENENSLLVSLKVLNQMFYTEIEDYFNYFQKTNSKFVKKWFDENVRNLPLHCIDAIQKRRKRFASYHESFKLTEEDMNLKTIVDADFDFVHYLCEHTEDWQLLDLFESDSSIQVYKSKENYSTISGMKLQKYITRVNYPIETVAKALLANEAHADQYGLKVSGKYYDYKEIDLNSSSNKYSTVIQSCTVDFGPLFRKRCLENVISAKGTFTPKNELVEVTQLYKTCSYLNKDEEDGNARKIVMMGTRYLQKEDSSTTRIVDARMFHLGGVMNANLLVKLSVKKMVQLFSDYLNTCLENAKKNNYAAPDVNEHCVWRTFSDYSRMHYKIDVNK